MKRTLLVLSSILSFASFGQDCSELFISEYVEGWSNNKALEIYNPTSSPIDLSQYIVVRFSNGATSAGADYGVQLSGTIQPYDVYVGVLDKQDPQGSGNEAPVWDSLAERADGWYSPDYNINKTWYWNGNDAVVLAKGDVNDIPNAQLVDVFGKIGENPGSGTGAGWTADFPYVAAGDTVTANHSMIRKPSIMAGETNPNVAYFNPLLEYDSIPPVVDIGGQLYGNWFTLGSHDCGCNPLNVESIQKTTLSVFPNPSNGTVYINGAENYNSIAVVNSLGQAVMNISNNSKMLVTLDLGKRRGVYFVKLTGIEGNTVTKRVIVK